MLRVIREHDNVDAMTRHLFAPIACVMIFAACATDPGDPFTSLTSGPATLSTTNADTLEAETGDGDGDADTGTSTGDGDGDPTTGDGDGDPTTGDGDGDAGDGDGDPTTTGDGDGDPQGTCGWFADPSFPGYYCDGSGEDPEGLLPIDCPPGLAEGAACGELTGAGCCDANGDNWYCGDDGQGNTSQVFVPCS
jgi:hypothetical protein